MHKTKIFLILSVLAVAAQGGRALYAGDQKDARQAVHYHDDVEGGGGHQVGDPRIPADENVLVMHMLGSPVELYQGDDFVGFFSPTIHLEVAIDDVVAAVEEGCCDLPLDDTKLLVRTTCQFIAAVDQVDGGTREHLQQYKDSMPQDALKFFGEDYFEHVLAQFYPFSRGSHWNNFCIHRVLQPVDFARHIVESYQSAYSMRWIYSCLNTFCCCFSPS